MTLSSRPVRWRLSGFESLSANISKRETDSSNLVMIGIYDASNNKLLERCNRDELQSALRDWADLGYDTYLGPAFPNMILLYERIDE